MGAVKNVRIFIRMLGNIFCDAVKIVRIFIRIFGRQNIFVTRGGDIPNIFDKNAEPENESICFMILKKHFQFFQFLQEGREKFFTFSGN